MARRCSPRSRRSRRRTGAAWPGCLIRNRCSCALATVTLVATVREAGRGCGTEGRSARVGPIPDEFGRFPAQAPWPATHGGPAGDRQGPATDSNGHRVSRPDPEPPPTRLARTALCRPTTDARKPQSCALIPPSFLRNRVRFERRPSRDAASFRSAEAVYSRLLFLGRSPIPC